MVQLRLEGDGLPVFQTVHIPPQKVGKPLDGFPGGFRVGGAQGVDDAQGIVQEVGLDLAEHDVDPSLSQLLFLLLQHDLVLELHVHQDEQRGHGKSRVDQDDIGKDDPGQAAGQGDEDVQQKEHKLPSPQHAAVAQDNDGDEKIAEQHHTLEQREPGAHLQAVFIHCKGGARPRGSQSEEQQQSCHGEGAHGTELPFPAGQLQVFKKILEKKEQQTGKRPVVERPSQKQDAPLPCLHNGVHQVFRQAAQGHADICHADQQRVQVQLPFIPVVADEVTGG